MTLAWPGAAALDVEARVRFKADAGAGATSVFTWRELVIGAAAYSSACNRWASFASLDISKSSSSNSSSESSISFLRFEDLIENMLLRVARSFAAGTDGRDLEGSCTSIEVRCCGTWSPCRLSLA